MDELDEPRKAETRNDLLRFARELWLPKRSEAEIWYSMGISWRDGVLLSWDVLGGDEKNVVENYLAIGGLSLPWTLGVDGCNSFSAASAMARLCIASLELELRRLRLSLAIEAGAVCRPIS